MDLGLPAAAPHKPPPPYPDKSAQEKAGLYPLHREYTARSQWGGQGVMLKFRIHWLKQVLYMIARGSYILYLPPAPPSSLIVDDMIILLSFCV